jgi:bifunctional UDP-N-acetylglucosamine pyrophosphorylase/glucosamine-1-phosphate N-acetyltransferase
MTKMTSGTASDTASDMASRAGSSSASSAHGAAQVATIVLAAGRGTRMKSRTPKVLHPVCGKPMVAWVTDAVAEAGVADDVVVVVGHGAEAVTAALAARHGARVRTVLQAEQRGTGHAVQVALPALSKAATAVLVVCGDTPRVTSTPLSQLVKLRESTGAAVAMWTTHLASPRGYGRIVRDERGHICAIVEEKDATDAQRAITEVNPGVYCFDAAFLAEALPRLSADNAAGELYLTDVIAAAVAVGAAVASMPVDAAITHGVNDRLQLAEAEAFVARRIVDDAMRAGVTVHDPGSVVIGPDVKLATDVDIGPRCILTGKSRVAEGAVIGPGCVIVDSVIDEGAVVHAYSLLQQARVGRNASVGPFARLRPDADVGDEAHVGNFVELKKTKLGRGSKANHLAYLGDAVIGAGVNVGAGTITCNYDGIGKHVTTLEDGVFVGSNSTLVAPVVVGKDAYVAAGSVITDAVPEGAVAFGRARQTNKPGRAAEVRAKNARRAGKKSG